MGPRSSPLDLGRGVGYALNGFAFVRQNRDLARYWLPPIGIVSGALVLAVWTAGHYHDDLLFWLWPDPAGSDWFARALRVLHTALEGVAFLLIATLLSVLCLTLSSVIAAPFNDVLSEVVEQRLTGVPAAGFTWARVWRDARHSVGLEFVKLAAYVSVMGPLFVLSWLVPGIGHAAYVVVGSLFTSAYFALDYVDWPASRRGRGVAARLALLRQRPFLMLGFGGAVWLCMWVPFVNLWLMPAAVAGGTRLFLDLERVAPAPKALRRESVE